MGNRLSAAANSDCLELVSDKDKELGLEGADLRIVDMKKDEVIAHTTNFINKRDRHFCRNAPGGTFSIVSFSKRALNLEPNAFVTDLARQMRSGVS